MQQACLQNLYSRLVDDSTENYFVMLLTYLNICHFMVQQWITNGKGKVARTLKCLVLLNDLSIIDFTTSEKMNSLFNNFLWQKSSEIIN